MYHAFLQLPFSGGLLLCLTEFILPPPHLSVKELPTQGGNSYDHIYFFWQRRARNLITIGSWLALRGGPSKKSMQGLFLKPLYTRAPSAAVARGAIDQAQAQPQRRPAASGASLRACDDGADGADWACVSTSSRGPHTGSVGHTARRLPSSSWYPSECTQKQRGQQRATSSTILEFLQHLSLYQGSS